jgi:hypothetical protein
MAFYRDRNSAGIFFLTLMLFAGSHSSSWGQKPPPPVPPNPQAPVLNMPAPMGVQRGTTMELTLTGANLAGPSGLFTGFPAKITIPTDNKNGLDNTKVRVRLEVPADAPLGYHALRLATTRGISNLRLFCIDDLPQVLEIPASHVKTTPQPLPVPCVVAGTINAEQGSYFKINVKAGQRLTFDVLGRRLGGLLDPELTIFEMRGSMAELAHQNDSPGCQTDARLTHTFREAGDYLIEIKDVLNRGGGDYPFRLRIGDFPNATLPVPMAAKRGSAVTLNFAGPMVEGVAPVTLTTPTDPAVDTIWVTPRGPNGLHGWPVALALSDHDELVEQEPNNEPGKAQRIPVPGGVTGRFQQSNDVDIFQFSAKKGQKLRIQAETLELYAPTLVFMVLKNAKSKSELPGGRTNPEAAAPADQRIEFTAPEDGDYLLEVQHLNFVGGPNEAYHLTITPSIPDFALSLGLDRFDLAAGSPLALNVIAARRGYNGPIDVTVGGHAGLSGSVQLKPGQTSATMMVHAAPDLAMAPYLVHVAGKAVIDGKPVIRIASVRPAVTTSLGNLPYPPRNLSEQVALAVRERPPFSLAMAWDQPESYPGAAAKLTILATRNPGFDEIITLDPLGGLPPEVPVPKVPPIPKGKNEVKVDVNLAPKAPRGEYLIVVSGKTKFQNKDFQASSSGAKLLLGLPFSLKVEPAVLQLKQGAKGKLKIDALRKGGYAGPIAVELRKLPAGVSAAKATIALGQDAVEVEVTVAPTAAIAAKADVDALGTATAAGNQQSASPAFTISILKK